MKNHPHYKEICYLFSEFSEKKQKWNAYMSLVSNLWGFYKFQDEQVVETGSSNEIRLLKMGMKH